MGERTLYDEQGNAVKVPEEADLKTWQEKAEAAAALEAKLKEAEENAKPDWKAAREALQIKDAEIARLRKLEEKGKTVNDQGEVVDFKGTLSAEEIERKATEAAERATSRYMVDARKDEYLSSLDEDKREVVKHFFDKLSAGEQLSVQKVDEYMQVALRAASPGGESRVNRAINAVGSAPRVQESRRRDFSETDEGKGFASSLGLRFVNDKNS